MLGFLGPERSKSQGRHPGNPEASSGVYSSKRWLVRGSSCTLPPVFRAVRSHQTASLGTQACATLETQPVEGDNPWSIPRIWRGGLVLVEQVPTREQWLIDFQRDFWGSLSRPVRVRLENLSPLSGSQLYQDLFVLAALGFPRRGFFVEVGAADGTTLSNSLLLEQFGWTGILSEPARVWADRLRTNRRAVLDPRAVWSHSGEDLWLKETNPPELSTLKAVNPPDMHRRSRESSTDYLVPSVSLLDLLQEYGAPSVIDFISIDAEGAELAILDAFDFSAFVVKVLCIEHNYTDSRSQLQALMKDVGFLRVTSPDALFDDWYVHASVADSCGFALE